MEYKPSTEHLAHIQSTMGDILPYGILVHEQDESGLVIYANKLLTEWCRGEVPNSFSEVTQILCGGTLQEFLQDEYGKMEKNSAVLNQELITRHFLIRNVSIKSYPMKIDAKSLRIWVFQDLTYANDLKFRQDVAVALESVSTFVHGVAHNFNNILAGIMGSASLLSRQVQPDSKAKICVETIKKAADAGAQLTRKMMAMVRDPNILCDEKNSENIAAVIGLVVDSCSFHFKDRILFQIDCEQDLPHVNVNVRNLADILGSVIFNSIDAIEKQGWILIRACSREEGKKVEVSISDNGRGMDSATMKRIFEPFFTTKNIDKAYNVSINANGLGMWNVYNLVRLLGGEIQVDSALNTGTRVTICFPAVG